MTVTFLLWLVIGAALIVAEIMTGTFYLLIFGLAAWAGAGMAYAGHGLDYQLGTAGASAIAGLLAVRYAKKRAPASATATNDLDIGNEVSVESANGSRLKVMYRGASWDAVVEDGATPLHAGDIGTIRAVRGNVLVVQPARR